MIFIDLFCGAGAGAEGYHQVLKAHDKDIRIIGVDIKNQPNYPFEFCRADALELQLSKLATKKDILAVHASPPCQGYIPRSTSKTHPNINRHPRLIAKTREKLNRTGLPFIIENVELAANPHNTPPNRLDPNKLINATLLCGLMFPSLRVIRHRWFETNKEFTLKQPRNDPVHPLVFTHKTTRRQFNKLPLNGRNTYYQITGGNVPVKIKKRAMGIPQERTITSKELNEAIPPAYTRYIGKQLLKALDS